MHNFFRLPLLTVFAVLTTLLAVPRAAADADALLNQPAPAWTLKDLEGKAVSLADYKGKLVVIDFWATWCGPCRMEIPGYIELQKKYGKDGLVIIGVSLDQKGPAHVKKFVEKNGINYPVVMSTDALITTYGDFTSIPTTFLVDRSGKVIHTKSGAMDHAEYEVLVKKAL